MRTHHTPDWIDTAMGTERNAHTYVAANENRLVCAIAEDAEHARFLARNLGESHLPYVILGSAAVGLDVLGLTIPLFHKI
jgi:hypothetical protein